MSSLRNKHRHLSQRQDLLQKRPQSLWVSRRCEMIQFAHAYLSCSSDATGPVTIQFTLSQQKDVSQVALPSRNACQARSRSRSMGARGLLPAILLRLVNFLMCWTLVRASGLGEGHERVDSRQRAAMRMDPQVRPAYFPTTPCLS